MAVCKWLLIIVMLQAEGITSLKQFATIFPKAEADRHVLFNDTLNVTLVINDKYSQNHNASEIKCFNKNNKTRLYSVSITNEKTGSFQIVGSQETCNKYPVRVTCHLGGQDQDISVRVLCKPTKPSNIQCFNYNMRLINCTWDKGKSVLPTTNKWQLKISQDESSWYSCLNGTDTWCTLPNYYLTKKGNSQAAFKPLQSFWINVSAQNTIGISYSESRKEIRPMDIVKVDQIKNFSLHLKRGNNYTLQWTPPSFPEDSVWGVSSYVYQFEAHSNGTMVFNQTMVLPNTSENITILLPDVEEQISFSVRVKLDRENIYWSDWSMFVYENDQPKTASSVSALNNHAKDLTTRPQLPNSGDNSIYLWPVVGTLLGIILLVILAVIGKIVWNKVKVTEEEVKELVNLPPNVEGENSSFTGPEERRRHLFETQVSRDSGVSSLRNSTSDSSSPPDSLSSIREDAKNENHDESTSDNKTKHLENSSEMESGFSSQPTDCNTIDPYSHSSSSLTGSSSRKGSSADYFRVAPGPCLAIPLEDFAGQSSSQESSCNINPTDCSSGNVYIPPNNNSGSSNPSNLLKLEPKEEKDDKVCQNGYLPHQTDNPSKPPTEIKAIATNATKADEHYSVFSKQGSPTCTSGYLSHDAVQQLPVMNNDKTISITNPAISDIGRNDTGCYPVNGKKDVITIQHSRPTDSGYVTQNELPQLNSKCIKDSCLYRTPDNVTDTDNQSEHLIPKNNVRDES